jgi:hypothetical protein
LDQDLTTEIGSEVFIDDFFFLDPLRVREVRGREEKGTSTNGSIASSHGLSIIKMVEIQSHHHCRAYSSTRLTIEEKRRVQSELVLKIRFSASGFHLTQ